jgi:hypothetical protein
MAAGAAERDTEVVEGLDVVGGELGGAFELWDRFVGATRAQQREAEVVAGVREVRAEAEGGLVIADRGLDVAALETRRSQVRPRGGILRVEGDRAFVAAIALSRSPRRAAAMPRFVQAWELSGVTASVAA